MSFQSSLNTVQHLLHLPGWLGDSNFGGTPGPSFVTLRAGGLYAVPPQPAPSRAPVSSIDLAPSAPTALGSRREPLSGWRGNEWNDDHR